MKVAELRKAYGGKTQQVVRIGGIDYEKFSAALPYLSQLSELRILRCGSQKLTAEDILEISAITQLENLSLVTIGLSSRDLEPLSKLKNLKKLEIYGAEKINDDVFATIAQLDLKELSLQSSNITGSRVELLESNKNLAILHLGDTKFEDEFTPKLLKLPQLVQLHLHDTKITEAGIRNLLGMPHLLALSAPDLPTAKQIEFGTIATKLRQEARAAGLTDAPVNQAPYASALEK